MELCQVCGLPVTQPQVVVSRGNPQAKLMVIGEAPGASEDEM
ncbi:MAG: uracil-DNA glycosylase, partial [Prochlorococcaceae cyanobacterium ETNP7_MAG_30]|nr:uracil-DNA glycosylase [Prochlorococcaceae cyanobacterium ETNP7_MAG_30]